MKEAFKYLTLIMAADTDNNGKLDQQELVAAFLKHMAAENGKLNQTGAEFLAEQGININKPLIEVALDLFQKIQ